MRKKKSSDHVIWDLAASIVRCEHCRDWYAVNMPCPLNIMGAIVKEYLKNHRNCKARIAANSKL